MSLFFDLWAANVAPAIAAVTATGLSVDYTPNGGSERTITVDVHDWGKKIDDEERHLTEYDYIKLLVDVDATTGMAAPGLGDSLVIPSFDPDAKWDFYAVVQRGTAKMQVEFRHKAIYRAGQVQPADL